MKKFIATLLCVVLSLCCVIFIAGCDNGNYYYVKFDVAQGAIRDKNDNAGNTDNVSYWFESFGSRTINDVTEYNVLKDPTQPQDQQQLRVFFRVPDTVKIESIKVKASADDGSWTFAEETLACSLARYEVGNDNTETTVVYQSKPLWEFEGKKGAATVTVTEVVTDTAMYGVTFETVDCSDLTAEQTAFMNSCLIRLKSLGRHNSSAPANKAEWAGEQKWSALSSITFNSLRPEPIELNGWMQVTVTLPQDILTEDNFHDASAFLRSYVIDPDNVSLGSEGGWWPTYNGATIESGTIPEVSPWAGNGNDGKHPFWQCAMLSANKIQFTFGNFSRDGKVIIDPHALVALMP